MAREAAALPEQFEGGDERRHDGNETGPLRPQGAVYVRAQGREAGFEIGAQGGDIGLRGQRIAVGADRVANDAGDGFGLPALEPGLRKRLCGGERVEGDPVHGA